MENIILTSIYVLFIILGISSFIKTVILMSLKTDDDYKTTVIIPIKGHEEKIEFIIRSEAAKMKWNDISDDLHLVCLDCGMDSETRRICSLMCKDYDFVYLKELDTLSN